MRTDDGPVKQCSSVSGMLHAWLQRVVKTYHVYSHVLKDVVQPYSICCRPLLHIQP